ncbi:MAG: lactate utilization protein [Anaerolineae bacterium]|nr:lactate utilization protein [Anaerolineae bacterium]
MSHRDKFLNRIRTNLADALLPAAEPQHPGSFQAYSFNTNQSIEALVERFEQELTALSGQVYRVEEAEGIAEIVLSILEKHDARQIMSWGSAALEPYRLSEALQAGGIEVVERYIPAEREGHAAQLAALDNVRVGLTGANGALADTGAIALISGPDRGRLASLLPPVHIAILSRQTIYPSLPAFLAEQTKITAMGSNLVFIAGPSRTGDIEMTLTMGVHGPGEVHVIITP